MPKKKWTFITSHGIVLAFIARHKQVSAADIADAVSLTERSVRRVIADLEEEGYIQKEKAGWYNRYNINTGLPLRRRVSRYITIGELLRVFRSARLVKKRREE